MTSTSQRALALSAALSAMVVLGTATSLEAAPKKSAPKKPSKTAKPAPKPSRNGSPSTSAEAESIRLAAERRNQAANPRAAALAEPSETPRPADSPALEPDELKAALARRQSWTAPRNTMPSPAVPETTAPTQLAKADTNGNAAVIKEALRHRGTRYVWGGASRGGFDCSGFICMVFEKMHGMKLPHSASAQSLLGKPVTKEKLQPGDVVFFTTYRPGVSHVGIWLGNNKFIHAANSRKGCRIDTLSGYYAKRYKWARRYVDTPTRFSDQDLKQIIDDTSEVPFGEDR